MKDLLETYRKVSKMKDICNELSNNITELKNIGNAVELLTDEEQKLLLDVQMKIELIGTRANTEQLKMKNIKR